MKNLLLKFARELRRKSTNAERELWACLRAKRFLGLKFKRQVPKGGHIADFVCYSKKIVIEIDGGHHAGQEYKDMVRSGWFKMKGFKVLRFWNNEVLCDIDSVLEKIYYEIFHATLSLSLSRKRERGLDPGHEGVTGGKRRDKQIISNKRGQAAAEFVIVIPVLLLLLTGIFQFALLAIDRIKLAMVEREVMMFLTEEDKADKWSEFGKETAEKLGMTAEKICVFEKGEAQNYGENSTRAPGPLSVFKGLEFVITYEHELMPAFKLMTGKQAIKLKTGLVSASGGCMKVKLKKGITDAFDKVFGRGGPRGNE